MFWGLSCSGGHLGDGDGALLSILCSAQITTLHSTFTSLLSFFLETKQVKNKHNLDEQFKAQQRQALQSQTTEPELYAYS